MVDSTLDGLIDVVFLKGNTIAGANGSTERRGRREVFAACSPSRPAREGARPACHASTAARGGRRVRLRRALIRFLRALRIRLTVIRTL